ncbi:uncharacterized protein LOC141590142 [Silene latifolia]|uniref:uncharacterized protein LOC141590142 n=1 Tax=Silene latifolia TaxID=37657 RepID=UPI003D77C45D
MLYNSSFAFTSFGVKRDRELAQRNRGIYTFRVQGQAYHFINDILPTAERPRYIQLYFFDTDLELWHRLQILSDIERRVVQALMGIMELNPYTRFFRSLRNIGIDDESRIIIKSDPFQDQRTHNASTTSQVAAIWIDDENSSAPPRHDVVVHALSGTSHRILHYYDSHATGQRSGANIGRCVILPATFIGCDRDFRRRYLSSMAVVQRYGKPDIFLTMTCNPRWPEIERELSPFEEAQNKPDLISRVFRAKLFVLKKDICVRKIFGHVAGYVYVVEFQKKDRTTNGRDSYPIYRRRNTGVHVIVRGSELNNQWVVPYNPFLLAKYDCHLNVEICSTIKAVKYMYKYVYKGHDRLSFAVTDPSNQSSFDEITAYQSAYWITPPEATWRIFGFHLNEIHPNVVPLQVHLPNMQTVSFHPWESLGNVLDDDARKRTMLTAFFERNLNDNFAKTLLYNQFPEHYVWHDRKRDKFWTPREKGFALGRLV